MAQPAKKFRLRGGTTNFGAQQPLPLPSRDGHCWGGGGGWADQRDRSHNRLVARWRHLLLRISRWWRALRHGTLRAWTGPARRRRLLTYLGGRIGNFDERMADQQAWWTEPNGHE